MSNKEESKYLRFGKPEAKFRPIDSKPPSASRALIIYIVLISLFVILVTLIGVRQVKDTINFRKPGANMNPSFEEIMDGILRMESDPSLAVTTEQAGEILPVISPYIELLDVFSRLKMASTACLDDKQKKFIISTSGQPFKPESTHQIPPGSPRIEWIYSDLAEFAGETSIPNFNKNEDASWLGRLPGIEDLCEGLYRLKKSGRLTSSQAAYLVPYLKDIAGVYKKMDELNPGTVSKLDSIFSERQKNFMRNNHNPLPPDFIMTYLPDIVMFLNERAKY